MPRLIWGFAGRSNFVSFVMRWLIFPLKLRYFSPKASTTNNVKPDVSQWKAPLYNDVRFPTVNHRIYCRKVLMLSNQTSVYIHKCIRIRGNFLCVSKNICCEEMKTTIHLLSSNEPHHDKTNQSTQSDQSSLCAQWVGKDPIFLHADNEDSDQTGPILLVLSWGGSNIHLICSSATSCWDIAGTNYKSTKKLWRQWLDRTHSSSSKQVVLTGCRNLSNLFRKQVSVTVSKPGCKWYETVCSMPKLVDKFSKVMPYVNNKGGDQPVWSAPSSLPA